ncbi:MAG: helix-turn-helix transcriptional regulator [Acidimicrobiales bacterium]
MKAHNDPRRRHDSQLRRGFGDPPCAPAAETRSDGAVFEQTYRLAVRVMERRELLGLTQIELADKTGIDQGDISRIERGSILPNEKTLLRLADALGAEWRLIGKATT